MKVQIEINWYAKNYKFKYCIRVPVDSISTLSFDI